MRRAVLVGVAAALITVLLVSAATYVEMRYTQFGVFMRDSSVEMSKGHVSRSYMAQYGDPVNFLGRWVRLNQMFIEPTLCFLVGLFIGFLSRRVLISSLLGVTPIVAINWTPDALAGLSIALCLCACASVAAGTRYMLGRRSKMVTLPA